MDLASAPERVARSERLVQHRESPVYTDTASVRTASHVWGNRVPNRRLPTPCPDVGNSDADFRPEGSRALGARPTLASAPHPCAAPVNASSRHAPTRGRGRVSFWPLRCPAHCVGSWSVRRDAGSYCCAIERVQRGPVTLAECTVSSDHAGRRNSAMNEQRLTVRLFL